MHFMPMWFGAHLAMYAVDVVSSLKQKYVDVYNHLSDVVLAHSFTVAKLVRLEPTTLTTRLVFDQGWWFRLALLYALKCGARVDIDPFLHRAEAHAAAVGGDYIYELTRGKGDARRVTLARSLRAIFMSSLCDPGSVHASPCASKLLSAFAEPTDSDAESVCVTDFVRERSSSLIESNRIRTGDLLALHGIPAGTRFYKLVIVKESKCPTSSPIQEITFDHNDVVMLA